MFRVKFIFLLGVLLFLIDTAFSQYPQIKWWYDMKDESFGQSAAADIDGDGFPEIVFGCYRNDSCVYALNAEDGSLLWKYNTGGCNDAAPVIYDADQDDSLEVIVAGSCNPTTFCFRGKDGSVKWTTPMYGSDSPSSVADVDNDGKPEILHGEFGGYVICINGENGSVNWNFAVDPTSWIQTAPSIADFNNDGQLDFVVGNWSNSNHTVFAYRGDNHALLWSSSAPQDVMYHGTGIADLDRDGKPELVIGSYDGTLYAFNGDNDSVIWSYTYQSSPYYYIGAPVAIADLDKDGEYEIVFVDGSLVGCVSHEGDLKWQYTIPAYATAFRGVAIADIDGDDSPDVVFGTSDGDLRALRGTDGGLKWSFSLQNHYGKSFEIDHAPLIADFDKDGILEVFIAGGHAEYPNVTNNYGRAYLLSVGPGTGPDWLMFQHDVRRTCTIPMDTATSARKKERDGISDIVIYPNPAVSDVTVEFHAPACSRIDAGIFDLNGKPVFFFGPLTATAGRNILTWNGDDYSGQSVSPGIYCIRISSGQQSLVKKIILIPR